MSRDGAHKRRGGELHGRTCVELDVYPTMYGSSIFAFLVEFEGDKLGFEYDVHNVRVHPSPCVVRDHFVSSEYTKLRGRRVPDIIGKLGVKLNKGAWIRAVARPRFRYSREKRS